MMVAVNNNINNNNNNNNAVSLNSISQSSERVESNSNTENDIDVVILPLPPGKRRKKRHSADRVFEKLEHFIKTIIITPPQFDENSNSSVFICQSIKSAVDWFGLKEAWIGKRSLTGTNCEHYYY